VREQLTALGCDAAQGFVLSHPVPAAELARWLDERRRGRLGIVAG